MVYSNVILNPVRNELTQGYIFTGAYAPTYGDIQTFGIVITARCDIANNKANLINYLPIVRFEDWLNNDGRALFCSRLKNQTKGTLKNILKDFGYDPVIIEHSDLTNIYENIVKPKLEEKRFKKKATSFKDAIETLERIEDVEEQNRELSELTWKNKKLAHGLAEDLLNYKLAGFYFLSELDRYRAYNDGYVVLLRQANTLHPGIARKIPHGITRYFLDETPSDSHVALNFNYDDIAMPIGCLTSPNIEHLMQKFSELFGRIGVDDPAKDTVEQIKNKISKTGV